MNHVQQLKVPSRSYIANILVLSAGAGLAAWSVQMLQTRLTSVIAIDAVINGVLTNINAPQDGVISEMGIKTGDSLNKNQKLLALKNENVSKLEVAEINSRITEQQAELAQAEAQLAQLVALLQSISIDDRNQKQLEVVESQRAIDEAVSQLLGAKARYRLAKLQQQRIQTLVSEGAVAQADLDRATVDVEQQQAEIDRQQSRINALQTNLKASQLGLSLERSRSNYDPNIRRQEMQLQIANQQQVIQTLRQGILAAKAELAQARADVLRNQITTVKAPTEGLVWRLVAQPNQFIEKGESIGQMLDCSQRWVDVYVDEKAMQTLQPGSPAKIKLYGVKDEELQGRVSLVRSGTGRLNPGEDVAVPITPNTPRTSQVRVELDPDSDKGSQQKFCYVGYTARVTFQVQDSPLKNPLFSLKPLFSQPISILSSLWK